MPLAKILSTKMHSVCIVAPTLAGSLKLVSMKLKQKKNFFESAILIFFFAYPYLNQSQINGVAWMGLNFYDYRFPEKSEGSEKL